jgi:hypothetical protein
VQCPIAKQGATQIAAPPRWPHAVTLWHLQAFRDNERLAIDSQEYADHLWSHTSLSEVCAHLEVDGKQPVGLNPNLRLYKCASYACHTWRFCSVRAQLQDALDDLDLCQPPDAKRQGHVPGTA